MAHKDHIDIGRILQAIPYSLYGTTVFRNQSLKTDKNVIMTPSIKHIEPAIKPHGCILSPRDPLTACDPRIKP